MWHRAESRLVRHVCLRNPCLLWNPYEPPLPTRTESGTTLHLLCIGCIMPIPSLQLQKRMCLMQRSRVFGQAVVFSKICCVRYSDCVRVRDIDCARNRDIWLLHQWTFVEIELLTTVGWKWGCQPFSCPCSQNVTHCRKKIYSTC